MAQLFGDKLKALRLSRELSQEELANILGTSKQVISRYETNQRTPKITTAQEYANRLDVPLKSLIDNSVGINDDVFFIHPNIEPLPPTQKLPLLGNIACGDPILAEENIEDYVDVPENVHADFVLRCKGDSMINARIFDGDVVFIRKQPDVENGEIAAVLIGEEATLKRIYHESDRIILQPENPIYRPQSYIQDEINNVHILGKAVAFLSTIR